MKEQPKSYANKISGSRSVQYHPRAILGDMFRKVKEAEDVPPANQRKKAQLQASKSFEEHLPGGPPQRRAPPKATKSFDETEFRSDVVRNGVRYPKNKIGNGSEKPCIASNVLAFVKPKEDPPVAPSEIMNVQPNSPDADTGTRPRNVQVEPSSDGNAKPKKVEAAGDVSSSKSKFVLGHLRSNLPAAQVNEEGKTVPPHVDEEAKTNPPPIISSTDRWGNLRRNLLPVRVDIEAKDRWDLLLDNLLAVHDNEETKKTNRPELERLDSLLGNLPKKVKAAGDVSSSKSMFVQYPIPYLASKIDNDGPANAYETLTMIDIGPQHEASADSSDGSKTVKDAQGGLPGSQRTQLQFPASKSIAEGITNGPPKNRAPPKATKSFNGNSRRRQLAQSSSLRSLKKINEGSDKPGAASNTPAFVKPKKDPPAGPSEIMKAQLSISSSIGTGSWSRNFKVEPSIDRNAKSKCVQYSIPYLASKIDNDETANAFKTLIATGLQHAASADSGNESKAAKDAKGGCPGSQRTQPYFPASKPFEGDIPGRPPKIQAPPKAPKPFDGSEYRSVLGRKRGDSLKKITEANHAA
jgi:hypothetical protein